jgi:hypothetical protein
VIFALPGKDKLALCVSVKAPEKVTILTCPGFMLDPKPVIVVVPVMVIAVWGTAPRSTLDPLDKTAAPPPTGAIT